MESAVAPVRFHTLIMFLKSLSLINFKNYPEAELDFSPSVNCFTGNNGAGKTNLLDAIHYLSLCKSYFNSIDSQQIREGSDFFMLQGVFEKNARQEIVSCSVKRNQKKQFRRNKKEYERLADHIGLFPVVMISPYDISLILEGSEERRRFIDNALSQTDSQYLDELISYNKALLNRNSLLKEFQLSGRADDDLLDIFTEKLIVLGQEIFDKRNRFMTVFLELFVKHYQFISQQAEEVSLNYQSQLHEIPYSQGMQAGRQRDRLSERTNFGIHKDDLEFRINSMTLKKFASQGQQKSFLIALKLAHYSYLKMKTGIKPVLLLDDIFDKLDGQRIRQLMQMVVQDEFGQLFVTDTDKERVQRVFNEIDRSARLISVQSGSIIQGV